MSPLDRRGDYVAPDEVREDAAVASAARTASGTGASWNTSRANSVEGFLVITAHAGTTPTLDVRLETSVDGGTSWTTVAAFAQQTTDATVSRVFGPLGDACRWAWTVGGTTPSFTFSIAVEANN